MSKFGPGGGRRPPAGLADRVEVLQTWIGHDIGSQVGYVGEGGEGAVSGVGEADVDRAQHRIASTDQHPISTGTHGACMCEVTQADKFKCERKGPKAMSRLLPGESYLPPEDRCQRPEDLFFILFYYIFYLATTSDQSISTNQHRHSTVTAPSQHRHSTVTA